MLQRFRTILQQICHLHPNKLVLAGVSGGPDSLVLLDVLHRLGFPILVAHLNHGLRPEAEAEARQVEQVAISMGLPFVLGREAVSDYAEANLLSIEEAARLLRYRFLFSEAEKNSAQVVAVAHNADDQVETVLMHLLRGSGLDGLKGMPYCVSPNPWSQSIPLVRPLLDVWRTEVEAYCTERGLDPVTDRTNLDTTYFRNRLRHELLPYLESYNPAIRQALKRTARVMAGDSQVLEGLVEVAWQQCLDREGPGYVSFHLPVFARQQIGMQRRLFRRSLAALRPGLRDVDFEMVERALAFASSPTAGGRRDLGAGLTIYVEGDLGWVAAWEADLPLSDWPQVTGPGETCKAIELGIPANVYLPGDWVLSTRPVEDPDAAYAAALANADPYQAWVDADCVKIPLHVRCRQSGDRIKPLGMEGHSMTLSDYMINVKIPRRARTAWPVVVSDDEIAWIPGYRLGYPFRLTKGTQRAVHLHLLRNLEKE